MKQFSTDDFVTSFAKGLLVLEAFGIERQKLNVSQIAQKTTISRTAVRRYLKTLVSLGYLETDDQFFWLTHRVLRFSSAYLNTNALAKITQPVLNLLNHQSRGLTFSVAVLDDHEVVPIARSQSILPDMHYHPHGAHLGNRLPAYATSTGKVLLSYLSEPELEYWQQSYPLKRLTPFTITDNHQLKALLNTIRQQDYCLSKEEHELGVIAIAVPLVNMRGEIVAALNCVSQTNKTSEQELLHHVLPLLRKTAMEIRGMM